MKVITVKSILEKLNGKGKSEPWFEVEALYILSKVKIKKHKLVDELKEGLVLRAFINSETGEVKTFLVKWLDIPEAKELT